jgi:uncharacterized membrane protein
MHLKNLQELFAHFHKLCATYLIFQEREFFFYFFISNICVCIFAIIKFTFMSDRDLNQVSIAVE